MMTGQFGGEKKLDLSCRPTKHLVAMLQWVDSARFEVIDLPKTES